MSDNDKNDKKDLKSAKEGEKEDQVVKEAKAEETKEVKEPKVTETKEVKEPKENVVSGAASDKDKDGGDKDKKKPPRRSPWRSQKPPSSSGINVELEERVVAINRVAKVVKGGRRFSFSALVVVGDRRGKVGYGLGKAKEVPEAIRKAKMIAEKSMIPVAIEKGTIPHEVLGEWDAGKILFRPAAEGTGIKAAGACRSILELSGIENVLTKSLRGNSPHNIVKATFQALVQLRSKEQIAQLRGLDVQRIRI